MSASLITAADVGFILLAIDAKCVVTTGASRSSFNWLDSGDCITVTALHVWSGSDDVWW